MRVVYIETITVLFSKTSTLKPVFKSLCFWVPEKAIVNVNEQQQFFFFFFFSWKQLLSYCDVNQTQTNSGLGLHVALADSHPGKG